MTRSQQGPDSDGDEPEIEIVTPPPTQRAQTRPLAAARMAPPRRRSANPTADDIIESGEIVIPQRRSLVIRASTPPPRDVHDEPTQPTGAPWVEPSRAPPAPLENAAVSPAPLLGPAPQAVASTRRRVPWAWLLAAIAPAAAAVGLIVVEASLVRPAPTATSLAASTQLLVAAVDGKVESTAGRARALASSSMLRAGILTDAATMRDMVEGHDLDLAISPGEVVEIVQLTDDRPTLLLRTPADAAPLPTPSGPARAPSLALRSGVLTVIASGEVPPASGVGGQVVLASPVDLTRALAQLRADTTSASLHGAGEALALVRSPAANAPRSPELSVELTTSAGPLRLVATPRLPAPSTVGSWLPLVRWMCAGATALLLAVFTFGLMQRRPA